MAQINSTLSPESKTLAQAYIDAGFILMPCTRTKAPRFRGWRLIKPGVHTPDNLPEFFAVILPDDICVLDVDPRRFPDGVNELTTLWQELGLARQETFIVKTGSGGYHIYFKKPPGVLLRGKCPTRPSIDIKTKGGYVMAAGSNHSVGTKYSVERGSPSAIAEIPKVLLDHITRPEITLSTGAPLADIEETETLRQLFISYLSKRDPGNDPQRYAVACIGRDYGISEDSVFRLMLEFYNPKCNPEWTENQLLRTVHNVFLYAQNEPGARNPVNDFASIEAPNPNNSSTASGNQIDDYDQYGANDNETTEDAMQAASSVEYEPGDDPIAFDWKVVKVGTSHIKVLNSTLTNILGYLRLPDAPQAENPLRKLFRFNEFTEEIEFTKKAPWHKWATDAHTLAQWNDVNATMMRGWFSDYKHLDCHVNLFHEAVVIEARKNAYNPVKDDIESVEWDGVPRLDKLLTYYCGVADKSEYTVAVGRLTIIGHIARIYNPGCQHDTMMVLEGEQGIGKTSFCRILGGKHFADITIDAHAKDTIHAMMGSSVIEASEMDFTRRQDVTALKRFLTITEDKVRLSYERTARKIPRRCIFIGTVNPEQGVGYLTDPTGNRRFLPVLCSYFRLEEFQRDRNQILAEALVAYRSGEKHWITETSVLTQARKEVEKRTAMDVWEYSIATWLFDDKYEKPDVLTTDHVALMALSIPASKIDRAISMRVSRVMKKCGFIMLHQYDDVTQRMVWSWFKDPFFISG